MGQLVKVLITIKTYPHPSRKYDELVCTGGVLEDGNFIRIYPINYRDRPYSEQYRKYQWIIIEVEKNPKDNRPESYRPVGAKLKILGEPLKSENNWAERKKYVLAKGHDTMCYLKSLDDSERSLGIIKPKKVIDVIVEEEEDRDWKPTWQAALQQMNLFDNKNKPLKKIPYKFKYHFICEKEGCKGHKMMNEDWEIGALFRRMLLKYDDENIAIDKVKHKMLSDICGHDKDTYFFVGTIFRYGTYVILGAFYPKKENSQSSFLK